MFNAKKTKVMALGRVEGKLKPISINEQEIEWVEHTKYLGRILSRNGSAEREI